MVIHVRKSKCSRYCELPALEKWKYSCGATLKIRSVSTTIFLEVLLWCARQDIRILQIQYPDWLACSRRHSKLDSIGLRVLRGSAPALPLGAIFADSNCAPGRTFESYRFSTPIGSLVREDTPSSTQSGFESCAEAPPRFLWAQFSRTQIVRPAGLEPAIQRPKRCVISISPQAQYQYGYNTLC